MSKAKDDNTDVKDPLGSEAQRRILNKTRRSFTAFLAFFTSLMMQGTSFRMTIFHFPNASSINNNSKLFFKRRAYSHLIE
jgi:hypothetical protein